MNGFLIDTNVVSEFVKPLASPQVVAWFRQANPANLFASVITAGEIRIGIENMDMGKRRMALEVWLETGLPAWFSENMLPVTRATADQWGRLAIKARSEGVVMSTSDALIAATASEHDLTLVTRNTKDFSHLEIPIFNPWETLLQ